MSRILTLFTAMLLLSFSTSAGVMALPPVISGNVLVCQGKTTVLTASVIPANPAVTYRWYTVATGGTPIFSGNPFTTPPLFLNTGYYVESVEGGVPSITRTLINIIIIANTDIPSATANPTAICPGGNVQLTANSLNGSTIFYWHNAPSGGTLLYTGQVFTTSVTVTTTFYLSSENTSGCVSSRTPVIITALPNADVPTGNASPSTTCPGGSVTLTGSSTNGSTIFNWYDAPISGTVLYTGPTYTTTVSSTTTFYLETESNMGCGSVRVPLTVIIIPNLDVPGATASPTTVCPGQVLSLTGTSANGSSVFKWYDAPTAGTLLFTGSVYNTSINTTTTFYLETRDGNDCASNRIPISVVATPNIDLPVASANPTTACPGDNVQLTGTSINGSTVFKWYDAPSAGTLLFTGSIYSTNANMTTVYYLETENVNGCKSIRTSVSAVVVPNLDVPIATANPTTICPGETVSLTGYSINSSPTFNWFDAPTLGNLLQTGNVYSTTVNTTTVFYLETRNNVGCPSARTPVTANVVPNSDVPVGASNPLILCPGENFTLSGSSLNGSLTFTWYDSVVAGNNLASGALVNMVATTSKVFYLESQSSNGCKSIRTAVPVLVNNNEDTPFAIAYPAIVCIGNTSTILGFTSNGSLLFNWYDAPTAGNILFSGPVFTPTITSSETFYLETQNATGCSSSRSPVQVDLGMGDSPTLASEDTVICDGSPAYLYANTNSSNSTLIWYDSLVSGNALYTGNGVYTNNLNTDLILYVEALDSVGCPGSRKKYEIFVESDITLDIPIVDCYSPVSDQLFFSWTEVGSATGFEISYNSGLTWSAAQSNNYILIKNLKPEQEVTIRVRAIYQGNMKCINPQGQESADQTCRTENFNGTIIIPYNTFSPNGDNVNDYWNIGSEVMLYTDNEVTIFNRLGQQVYQTTGYDNNMNVFNGKDLSVGSYYYVVKIPSLEFKQTGFINLTR